jgi:hypothetical protein
MSDEPNDPSPGHAPQDTDPVDAFDIEAWLAGARPPTRHVRVIGAGHLLGAYEELDARLADLRVPGSRATRPGMFVANHDQEEPRIVAQMTALRAEIDASTIDLRFQALPYEQQQELDDAVRDKDGKLDGVERQTRWIAAGCVSHPMSAAQARQMRLAIGEGQFDACWSALWAVSQQQPTVPFSLAHSVAAQEG